MCSTFLKLTKAEGFDLNCIGRTQAWHFGQSARSTTGNSSHTTRFLPLLGVLIGSLFSLLLIVRRYRVARHRLALDCLP
jgi:hypothetical protein